MQGESNDQVRHAFQAWEDEGFAELARHIFRELVMTGERQAGVGICCCPCWSGAEIVDLSLAARGQIWMRAEAGRREAEEAAAAAAPAQQQMSAPASSSSAPAATDQTQAAAPDQTQAEILQLLARLFQLVSPGHAHNE